MGDRLPLTRPDLLADPGGETDPDQTAPDYVNRVTQFDFDHYTEGTFPSELSCVITDEMTYQEKIEALNVTMYDYDDVCDNLPD